MANADTVASKVPTNVVLAIKHVRGVFENISLQYRSTTRHCCYAALHPDPMGSAELDSYKQHLQILMDGAGPGVAASFRACENLNTLPAIFKAYFDLYRNGMGTLVSHMFREFLEIARANKLQSPVEFAKVEQLKLIESVTVKNWIKEVCCKQPPTEDLVAAVKWPEWRAPLFLAMIPSGSTPYDPTRLWDAQDEPTSQRYLKYLSDEFHDDLKMQLENAGGQAYVELAKESVSGDPSIARTAKVAAERKTPPGLVKRNKVILEAIRMKRTGLSYCHFLDEQGIPIPAAWVRSRCPPKYAAAYKKVDKDDEGGLYPWRRRIQDMKSKVSRPLRSGTLTA